MPSALRSAALATHIAPRLPEAHLAQAIACQQNGDAAAALEAYARAASSCPGDMESKRRYLRHALDHGLHAEALCTLDQWLSTDTDLLREPLALSLLRKKPTAFGYCIRHGDTVVGWVVNSADKRLQLEADGQYHETIANRPTPELLAAGIGDGHNGFALRLPGAARIVRLGTEGISLWGSPLGSRLPNASPPPLHTPGAARQVDVIIPVFGHAEQSLACIAAVRAAKNRTRHRIVVVDDASQDSHLVQQLTELARQQAITLLRRPFNAGFSAAVNTALPHCAEHDVVLLNSDTLVADGWLDRMHAAAYSQPDAATVTPLSNNAELLSHPQPMRDAAMPDADALRAINQTLKALRHPPLPIPTGVGFCLLVRRDALQALHGLQETVFARGYAEDTDLCLRAAAAGWRNLAAPNVYVAHRGNQSFGQSKSWLAAANIEKLRQRYPEHEADYDRFLAQDPLKSLRHQLQRRLLGPLLSRHRLRCRLRSVVPMHAQHATSPAAWLVLHATHAELHIAGVPGLGSIRYDGKTAPEALAADLAQCGFSGYDIDDANPILPGRLQQWQLDNLKPRPTAPRRKIALCDPAVASPHTLLLPPVRDIGALRQVLSVAEAWASEAPRHQLIVLGTSYAAERLRSLDNVQLTASADTSDLARLCTGLGCTAIALHTGANTDDWQALGRQLGLPVLRLPDIYARDRSKPAARNRRSAATTQRSLPSGPSGQPDDSSGYGISGGGSYEGGIAGMHGVLLYGWARDPARPGMPVAVELEIDGLPVDLTQANLRRAVHADTADELPADCQFMFVIPAHWREEARSLRVRIANTAVYLPGEIRPQDEAATPDKQSRSKKPANRPSTWAANHFGLRIFGHAVDSDQPDRRLRIRLLHRGEQVSEGIANLPAAELRDSDLFDANHGFSLTLPLHFADGQTYTIQVVDEDGRELQGSPLTVQCTDQPLSAWARQINAPVADRALLVKLLENAQRHLPRSLDFSAYAEWKARFGSRDVPATQASVLVVIGNREATAAERERTLHSVLAQTHQQLTVLGADPHPDKLVKPTAKAGNAKALSNAARKHDYVACIEPGDSWHPNTLAHAVAALKRTGARVSYADCDFADGALPWFKPDWCLDTFLHQPLLHHGLVADAALVGDCALAPSPPSDWPWLIAAHLGNAPTAYAHIPHPHHTAGGRTPAPSAHLLQRLGERWAVQISAAGKPAGQSDFGHQIDYPDPAWPSVTLIVPTRDGLQYLKPCIDSLRRTDYPAFQICVVDNGSSCTETLAYLQAIEQAGVKVLRWPYPFNFSAINNVAVAQADSTLVCLVNNDIEAPDPGWLKAMVRQLMREGVGAVGAKLLWPNGMVQHAGVQLGLHGLAGHVGNNWHHDDVGYHHLATHVRSVSAVTAACLLVRRDDYLAVGGMDEQAFPVAFNDVDFCLRLRQSGRRIVITPEATLIHAESVSRGDDDLPPKRARLEREKARLWERWQSQLMNDPYYNPNLNLDRYSHSGLAIPPRHL